MLLSIGMWLAFRCLAVKTLKSNLNILYVFSCYSVWKALMLHAKETKNIPFALLPDSASTPLRAPGGFNQSVAISHGYVIAMLLLFDVSSVNQSASQSSCCAK